MTSTALPHAEAQLPNGPQAASFTQSAIACAQWFVAHCTQDGPVGPHAVRPAHAGHWWQTQAKRSWRAAPPPGYFTAHPSAHAKRSGDCAQPAAHAPNGPQVGSFSQATIACAQPACAHCSQAGPLPAPPAPVVVVDELLVVLVVVPLVDDELDVVHEVVALDELVDEVVPGNVVPAPPAPAPCPPAPVTGALPP
jgi:hypothetical protein